MNRMTPEGKAKLEELIARVMKDGQARHCTWHHQRRRRDPVRKLLRLP